MKLCIEINKNIDKKYPMRTHQINSGNLIILAHVFWATNTTNNHLITIMINEKL